LLVVISGGDVPLEQDMRVRVDETGEAGFAGEIDDVRSGGLAGADVADLVAFDSDDDVFARCVGFAVEERAAAEIADLGRRLRVLREGDGGEEQGSDQEGRALERWRILC
jgi:hypothetical protein